MPIDNFWLVWVAGRGGPKRIHLTLEEAKTEARRLREEVTGREVYVLAIVHREIGRKILTLGPRRTRSSCVVEPKAAAC